MVIMLMMMMIIVNHGGDNDDHILSPPANVVLVASLLGVLYYLAFSGDSTSGKMVKYYILCTFLVRYVLILVTYR